MRRFLPLLFVFFVGCSTAPLADLMDHFRPGGMRKGEAPSGGNGGNGGIGPPQPIDPLFDNPSLSIPNTPQPKSGPPPTPSPSAPQPKVDPNNVVPPPTLGASERLDRTTSSQRINRSTRE